jgi:hypothetical protein
MYSRHLLDICAWSANENSSGQLGRIIRRPAQAYRQQADRTGNVKQRNMKIMTDDGCYSKNPAVVFCEGTGNLDRRVMHRQPDVGMTDRRLSATGNAQMAQH